MSAVAFDLLELVLRWLHVITGIAWIGASFYFIWLDNSLEEPPAWKAEKGVMGDLWSFHGGGIYEVAKYRGAPPRMPGRLHWFYWEAYSTWITGTLLLFAVYYLNAGAYLVDSGGPASTPTAAIVASLLFVAAGVLAYELALRYGVLDSRSGLALALLAGLLSVCWLADWLFADRAAYIHVGILLGSIMVANVFLGIIPPQRAMIRAIEAGQAPDYDALALAKRRSTHNNYLTLPVLFCMVSNHYPVLYGHRQAWLILVATLLISGWARHFFNLRHRGILRPQILLGSFFLFGCLGLWLALDARPRAAASYVPEDADAMQLVALHCTTCHARRPSQPGFSAAPAGMVLESREDVVKHAASAATAVGTGYMPLANLSGMTDEERAGLVAWLQALAAPGTE